MCEHTSAYAIRLFIIRHHTSPYVTIPPIAFKIIHSPHTLTNLSSRILLPRLRYPLPPIYPVCARHLDPLVLPFCLSKKHRHPNLCIPRRSRFICYYKSKRLLGPQVLFFHNTDTHFCVFPFAFALSVVQTIFFLVRETRLRGRLVGRTLVTPGEGPSVRRFETRRGSNRRRPYSEKIGSPQKGKKRNPWIHHDCDVFSIT